MYTFNTWAIESIHSTVIYIQYNIYILQLSTFNTTYIIQQYFTVPAPHSVFSQYLKQIKYQMLVVVHPQSDENVRQRWGF